jgi:hypothetical protein
MHLGIKSKTSGGAPTLLLTSNSNGGLPRQLLGLDFPPQLRAGKVLHGMALAEERLRMNANITNAHSSASIGGSQAPCRA